eukprot:CAMPEP_0195136960 /NCGR_PEP_ID=MMETSP0448-20130528/155153_1 /TAXON_ID=66468 /ORGANISM="Heterocapsa triquestra, Strain CCMP 448" /LENGTH=730 /DNA_ID=CAMNT_0040175169 /DNA_START=89 /DNA_END=2279 /DNA_ORIENTATION=-
MLQDAAELLSLSACFCRKKDRAEALLAACLKTNAGDIDASVGIFALLRSLTAAAKCRQVPHLHVKQVNPHVVGEDLALDVTGEVVNLHFGATFAGVSSFGFGTNVHTISLGSKDYIQDEQPAAAMYPRQRIAFWAFGGEKQAADVKPERGYFLKGTWPGWQEAELMEDEGHGVHAATVVLGEERMEYFQIWVDGDSTQALTPADDDGSRVSPVMGPYTSNDGRSWFINGYETQKELAEPGVQEGFSGDLYRVRLRSAGPWRNVTWARIEPDGLWDTLLYQVAATPALGYGPPRQRDYDIVLYGATGFTGSLCARYLATVVANSKEPVVRQLRVALAGRSYNKLQDLQERYGLKFDTIIVDADDEASLQRLARSTNVCISTAGPFLKYSWTLARICCDVGTDYTDINGESPYGLQLIRQLHAKAQATGTFIVPYCGFDSVPSDLGCYTAVDVLRIAMAEHAGEPVVAETYMDIHGVVSGGTIASGIYMQENPRLEAFTRAAFVMGGSEYANQRVSHQDCSEAKYDDRVRSWIGPLETSRVNTRVVRRSALLFGEQASQSVEANRSAPERVAQQASPYSHEFAYREVGLAGSEAIARRMAAPALTPEQRRKLVEAGELPGPGQGPDERTRETSRFEARTFAHYEGRPETAVCISVRGRDPGYTETSKMVCESGIILALRHYHCYPADVLGHGRRGGVFTPAFAYGHILTRRLHMAGIVFSRVPLHKGAVAAE